MTPALLAPPVPASATAHFSVSARPADGATAARRVRNCTDDLTHSRYTNNIAVVCEALFRTVLRCVCLAEFAMTKAYRGHSYDATRTCSGHLRPVQKKNYALGAIETKNNVSAVYINLSQIHLTTGKFLVN